MEPLGNGLTRIKAHVPYAEILKYTIDLKGLTQGRGTFEINFSKYEIVPNQLQPKIIEKYSKKPVEA
jgi:elongation factor G